MFTPQGPTLRELAVQALSSVEHGYDLLAPKFDHTPFRTPDSILDAVGRALRPMGPFGTGLDLCCGTGAGMGVLAGLCAESVTGVDISAGMLAVGRERLRDGLAVGRERWGDDLGVGRERLGDDLGVGREQVRDDLGVGREPLTHDPASVRARTRDDGPPAVAWVRGDARALPFGPVFDLVVSFGAFGHFLPRERPGLFSQVHSVLRPGGRFAFPIVAPPRPSSPWYWALLGFDAVMRVRNAVWRPAFVMYYRAFRLGDVQRELASAGFEVELHALPDFGYRRDGSPRCRMVVARRGTAPAPL
ncbi:MULTISPECIES: class I SAM-dependent methyltransferase [Streptomyces]|uniref:Methyltransferase domain-containing protein n=1 Tax=Streptomyces dengpaensis TaxID=2049881 RepID=A0ABN5IDR7_9ACTN|nr:MULTISPECIES: methyltransferase domain-containing protein [Streptomyces]AVH60405.1 methyltransferase domain-containing protein [Streptomyces dengpaensis]PIB07675.1 SAM-dependent methyltransferase [Streptomyces sp. HG99]